MAKINFIKINPDELTIIKAKPVKVVDPIRFPAVQDPIEKAFMNNYSKMSDAMIKMLELEITKQIRS